MTDKIMEARRARFERFAREHYWLSEFPLNRDEYQPDEYVDPEMNVAWESYNAALDSMCVELPHIYEIAYHEEDGDGSWKAMTADRVIEAIHAAGVKTK